MRIEYYINASSPVMPIGQIMALSLFQADPSLLICNGEELNCEDYPELFNVLSDSYGGNLDWDVPTFNLPDLRGRWTEESTILDGLDLINPEDNGEVACYLDRIGV